VPKGVMVVEAGPSDPSREDEFNDWYTNVHLPELLSVPGFVRARRFKVSGDPKPGRHGYLAIYEIEADDLGVPLRELRARAEAGQSSRSDAVSADPPSVVTIYELIDDQSEG